MVKLVPVNAKNASLAPTALPSEPFQYQHANLARQNSIPPWQVRHRVLCVGQVHTALLAHLLAATVQRASMVKLAHARTAAPAGIRKRDLQSASLVLLGTIAQIQLLRYAKYAPTVLTAKAKLQPVHLVLLGHTQANQGKLTAPNAN